LQRYSKGFVYAATGAAYAALARKSARNLRAVMPDAQIDLFTDQTLTDPVFNQIIPLHQSWFRPKMEALLRSRFSRTVLLDADTIPLMDLSDMFGAVDRHSLAASMAMARPLRVYRNQPEIPRSFPYLNAGVLVAKRGIRLHALIREWEMMVRQNNLPKDQAALRWLLFHRKVPFAVLPMEYNLLNPEMLDTWDKHMQTPRILHLPALHDAPPGDPTQPFALADALGQSRADIIRALMAQEAKWMRQPVNTNTNPTGSPIPLAQRLRSVAQASVAMLIHRM
jgi:hypothetical protein